MQINELVKKAHDNAVNKGFWEEERSFGEQIALMHSELSEALEEYRKGNQLPNGHSRGLPLLYYSGGGYIASDVTVCCKKPEGIAIELADTVIRIFDTCGRYGIDLEQAIAIKMKYNEGRPHKHGKVI